MKELVLIESETLKGLARENLVSPESLQPTERYFSEAKIEELTAEMLDQVKEGWESGAKVHALGKFFAKLGKSLSDGSIGYALKEVEQHGKSAELFGAKFSVTSSGATYDFEVDTEYAELKEKLKYREDQLKRAFRSKETLLDEETGEAIPKPKLKSPSRTTLAVSFK